MTETYDDGLIGFGRQYTPNEIEALTADLPAIDRIKIRPDRSDLINYALNRLGESRAFTIGAFGLLLLAAIETLTDAGIAPYGVALQQFLATRL